jgi:hypothetical protein
MITAWILDVSFVHYSFSVLNYFFSSIMFMQKKKNNNGYSFAANLHPSSATYHLVIFCRLNQCFVAATMHVLPSWSCSLPFFSLGIAFFFLFTNLQSFVMSFFFLPYKRVETNFKLSSWWITATYALKFFFPFLSTFLVRQRTNWQTWGDT